MKFSYGLLLLLQILSLSDVMANQSMACPKNIEVVNFHGQLVQVARGSAKYIQKETLNCMPSNRVGGKNLKFKGIEAPSSHTVIFSDKLSPSRFDRAQLENFGSAEAAAQIFNLNYLPLQQLLKIHTQGAKFIQTYEDEDSICGANNFEKTKQVLCHIKSVSEENRPVTFKCDANTCSGLLPFRGKISTNIFWKINDNEVNNLAALEKMKYLVDRVIKIQSFLLDKRVQ